ncbi:MAG: 23S rRNA (guanosine(2251)-2'-O)-methyltransferase RlmB [Notoacmeibacter sp.]|nr:23S rRNA (guanosine(2251)-2'-O)-methyltransferase RlmB [Notoacmeibacter sp.]
MARRKDPTTPRTAKGRPHPTGKVRRERPIPKQTVAKLPARGEPFTKEDAIWLYGEHAVRAALGNDVRRIRRLMARTPIDSPIAALARRRQVAPEMVDRLTLESVLPPGAVHQGVALLVDPLPPTDIEEITDAPAADAIVVVLDQVTDPHNVGAILRSAVAFKAGALITTARHSPQESGVLAKSASGALEHIDHITVRNLAEALETLSAAGFTTIGLDSDGPAELEKSFSGNRIALVLGAEGKGLRQKTRETVDALARLDMPGAIRSLNVSNAAAISLYAATRHLRS